MAIGTPAGVNSRFPGPNGCAYVGLVKRPPKPKPIPPRKACILLMRMVKRLRRTVFGVLPRARRVRAANDPEA
jgi:hypothetical protein